MQRGLLAEFGSVEACLRAIHGLKERGIGGLHVYAPYPIKELEEALELPPSPLPRYVFVAGLLGAAIAYLILWYTNAYDYVINVGGRPSHAVPAFIPITFETTVLAAGCTAFFGALRLGGMPRLYHPLDELENFRGVAVDRFFVAVDASREGFDRANTTTALNECGALSVTDVGDRDAEERPRELEGERQ